AAELDVVAGDGDAPAAAMRVDLALDRMDILDRGEIEILAPKERPQLAEEGERRVAIAGDRPRLDESGALPVLSGALVIGEGGARGDGGRGRAGIGTQPEISAEDITVGGTLGHHAH